MTFSYYYRDPDGNHVELQVDNFGDWAKSSAYMRESPEFHEDPIGQFVDPDRVAAAHARRAPPSQRDPRARDGRRVRPGDAAARAAAGGGRDAMTTNGRALEGRTALVTGASQGLGKVIATRFAREGARVVLAARSRERLEETAAEIEAAGGSALVVPTDLERPDDVDALAQRVAAEVGPLDAIVANSGIAGPDQGAVEHHPGGVGPDAARQPHRDVPAVPRAAAADDRAGRGSIVVIGSMTGKRPMHGRSPYAATKLGLVGLVRTLAAELGPFGIRANLISPGAVAGPRIEAVMREQARAAGDHLRAVPRRGHGADAAAAAHPARGRRRHGRLPGLRRLRLDHRRRRERLRRPGDALTPETTRGVT